MLDLKKYPSVGTAVEIKKNYEKGGVIWYPATVTFVDQVSMGVAYSDGMREVIRFGQGNWRYPITVRK